MLDIGMINNVEMVAKEMPFGDPVLYNFVFGHIGGIQPTMESLAACR